MKNTYFEIDLQLFAMIEGSINGTVSEGSTGTGSVQTTATGNTNTDLTPEMRIFYNKALIELASPKLIYGQLAQKKPIPQGNGKTISFRKFEPLAPALTPISEGVTPAGNKLAVTAFDATVDQYGDFVEFTDMIDLIAVDPIVTQALKLLSDQAGKTLEILTREEVVAGERVMYSSKVGTNGAETAVTARSALDATAKLKVKDILKAVAFLEGHDVPKYDGENYVCAIHPYAAFDIMSSPEWEDIQNYATPENRLRGEIGRIAGCRFVKSSLAKIWKGSEAPNMPSGLAVLGTMIFGADSFGESEITGGGLETFVNQVGSAGSADPLKQRGTVGWKATHVAKRLVDTYMIRIESALDPSFYGSIPENGN